MEKVKPSASRFREVVNVVERFANIALDVEAVPLEIDVTHWEDFSCCLMDFESDDQKVKALDALVGVGACLEIDDELKIFFRVPLSGMKGLFFIFLFDETDAVEIFKKVTGRE